MTGRLAIEDVRPRIAGGSQPSKAVIGEMIPVSALVWREGHDAVSATLNVISPTGEVTRTTMEPAPLIKTRCFPVLSQMLLARGSSGSMRGPIP